MGQTVDPARVSEAKNRMEEALDLLTNVWLKDKTFIVGNEITVADLVAATEIEQLGECSKLLTILDDDDFFTYTRSCHRLQSF